MKFNGESCFWSFKEINRMKDALFSRLECHRSSVSSQYGWEDIQVGSAASDKELN